eukprot:TRINITY_DN7148_c0_g1_i4.p2 TRINITY_DN7148_c0_g1~~TRINITY_DN7148_c0_g1_i4.p2  ORF type:complete len:119 (-),score=25.75 TRINITY_DN7148_c0_g1_i4:114-470(-)
MKKMEKRKHTQLFSAWLLQEGLLVLRLLEIWGVGCASSTDGFRSASLCPSCGNEIPVFESALKEGPQLCPYCNKPFTLESKESAWNPFKDFRNPRHESSTEEPSEMVVDVEAEVIDKD